MLRELTGGGQGAPDFFCFCQVVTISHQPGESKTGGTYYKLFYQFKYLTE